MRRDKDLILALILRLEELLIEAEQVRVVQPGCPELAGIVGSSASIDYHLKLMRQAGLIDCPTSVQPKLGVAYTGLTWAGHDMADLARNAGGWPEVSGSSAAHAAIEPVAIAAFSTFASRLILQNAAEGLWEVKTQRQAKSICDLFVKFLIEEQDVSDLRALRQHHVGKFVDFMRWEIYKHYGKSAKDEGRTIAELRAQARCRARGERGIEARTLNRHLTSLGQIFRYLAARGFDAFDDIDIAPLRLKTRKERARNERAKLALDQAAAIFRESPFSDRAARHTSTDVRSDSAGQAFHCSLYFVPLLLYYTGCRREELCGLTIDDVILANGSIPYIHVAANAQRRIKNCQSRRNMPLHPEVLRLNFLPYVLAIKSLGYQLVFPDLYSPSTRSPLGNRFYKQFKPLLKSAGATEKGLGSHAIRHLFGAQLKKHMIAEEDRADLLGHGGRSETSERYCEPHELATLYQFLQKLPLVTSHVQPRGIQLLPWVLERRIAPFSQPSRSKPLPE